jgi:hypothetical protein
VTGEDSTSDAAQGATADRSKLALDRVAVTDLVEAIKLRAYNLGD